MWTADRASLIDALSVAPEYLRNAASDAGNVIDYRDWQVPLGRRFRALKLWFVIRHYGVEGLRAHVREHIRLAAMFEAWVRADRRLEVAAVRTMNLVCFRLRSASVCRDEPNGETPENRTDWGNRRLMDLINASGRAYLTHTALPGVGLVLRMAVGATNTREEHVRATWDLIRETADGLVSSAP